MKSVAAMSLVGIFFVGCYLGNTYKLINCDFEAPYKCEGVHATGLIGPLAAITVWFPSDQEKN